MPITTMPGEVTPTLFVGLGGSGGPRIITSVAQVILNVLLWERPLQEAVSAPRIHHQWKPDRIMMEPTVDAAIVEGLQARGHEVFQLSEEKGWTRIGHANCIEVDPKTGAYTAVADVERDGGKASAY